MKIRIYSDLHLEFGRYAPQFKERRDEELVVLAGDIDVGLDGVRWAVETFPHVPVVYVLGNHEYYRRDFSTLVSECKSLAQGTNVHVLERDTFDVMGIRVLGTTLWTDFEALGADSADLATRWAQQSLADFLLIRDEGRRLSPPRTVELFVQSACWLDQQIAAADRPVLVVTHHAPTLKTVAPYFAGKISTTAFHSNADHLIRAPVRMWVHGHSHYNADAPINGVRVTSNQWGYPEAEAIGFRPHGIFTFA
ncbi:MAG: metallophosphoesterase [Hydrocarboniphaga effusa]|nr:metallophosphoesterase [Hydrocarboniphaga effusa]